MMKEWPIRVPDDTVIVVYGYVDVDEMDKNKTEEEVDKLVEAKAINFKISMKEMIGKHRRNAGVRHT